VAAERALQLRLVTEVVPHDQLLPRATEVAAAIAARDDEVAAAIRASYERALSLPADAAFAADAAASRAAGIPAETIADLADRRLPGEATSEATSRGTRR
jgi:enoyl-CoA hydratase